MDATPELGAGLREETLEKLRFSILELGEERIDQRQHTAFEWFLDNFYLISEAARTLREDLPRTFYRELPTVVGNSGEGPRRFPRSYLVAREILAHASSPPNRSYLEECLVQLQEQVPLTIGELWAFPALLRVICLERLAEALTRITDAVASVSEEENHEASGVADSDPDVVSLAVRTLIELKTIPWRLVFEHCSLVHKELRRDPAGVYAEMDFATCDRYRKAVEELAMLAARDELEIAEQANALAEKRANEVGGTLRRHVGFYLIGEGRSELEAELQIRPTLKMRFGRSLIRYATPVYLASIAGTTLALLALLWLYLVSVSAGPVVTASALVLASVPSSAFAIALIQWWITNLVKPKRLPRLALEKGIDRANRSMVVIPTLLGHLDEVHELVQRLELHYLANPDPNLEFAILADYTDALTETTPRDAGLLERAESGITLLNERYGANGTGPFHLLVRERRFNPSERVWMGWERKRGKLEEFNRLLAGSPTTSYSLHVGNAEGLEGIRFVVTLDSDTELPRDAARRLVATLAHPLNRATFEGDRLVSGYTVLQPRLDISPEASHRSRFSRIFAGDTGLDIYSRAVSNVYQDFFGSGVYVGKGIYDVGAFRRCLEGRVPENALLSHDLFEGIYGRAGLVTDIVLYEDYPPSYLTYARRLHRWIRGDWQLLPWLRRRVPTGAGGQIANPFSQIDRWKVIDNLRRSLLPITLLAMFVSGWTWLPGNPLFWTAATLTLSAGHVLTGAVSRLRGLFGRPLGSLGRSLVDVPNDIYRWLLSIAFLPHEAVVVTDAVLRTTLRMAFTRRRLLEWTTAAHTANLLAKRGQRSLQWWEMLGGPSCAIGAGVAIWLLEPSALPGAAVFLGLWLLSPEISLYLAKPVPTEVEELTPRHEKLLRQLSRRTWLFFETFVGPDDHWLPPDNVQMAPSLRIAHRTSPTNIGLYLASCASARDLGYLGLRDFCVRVQSTMRTLNQLQRHRGQLLNWYETQTLEPLLPKYVSTVDNGNFAAALIAVRQACGDFATGPIFRPQSFSALRDVVDLLSDCVACREVGESSDMRIDEAAEKMRTALTRGVGDPERWLDLLDELEALAGELTTLLERSLEEKRRSAISVVQEASDWLQVLMREIHSMRASIESLAGWYYELVSGAPIASGDSGVQAALARLRDQCFGGGLEQMHALEEPLDGLLLSLGIEEEDEESRAWALRVRQQFASALVEADVLLGETLDVGVSCEAELAKVDFGFLYDTEANQMFIGYDASSAQPDRHHYDLLASEARLASLVAIALDQVPAKHWAHLGRPVSRVAGDSILLSWSGTMFEYLMPLLFTHSFPKTLLGRSTSGAVSRQIQYARHRGVPWGISESAFATTDARGDYQYRAFGAPGLGLKRGLEEDLVIAPYASILAVGLRPDAVVDNLVALRELGGFGEYGALEAIDFTPRRVQPPGQPNSDGKGTVVNTYMAHHQGMSMVAIGNLLAQESMIHRFHADPRVQTVAHLLHEKLPATTSKLVFSETPQLASREFPLDRVVFPEPWKSSVASTSSTAGRLVDPTLHVLSNGTLNLSCDSFGRSRLWITHGHDNVELRPREAGASQDREGSFCLYVEPRGQHRRLFSGGLAVTPTGEDECEREVTFWPHKVETSTHYGSLAALEEVFIAPHDNVEIRSLRLTNESEDELVVGVTGYAEVSIQGAEEHHRHPAFSRLFLQTWALEQGRILVCQRRPRGPGERHPVVAQAILTQDPGESACRWETSRSNFIGRGSSLAQPQWPYLASEGSAHEGHVLDPCLAQKVELTLRAGESQTVAWVTAVGIDEERALEALSPYSNLSSLPAIHDQSARATAHRLGQFDLTAPEVALFQHLLSRLVHRSERGRAGAADRRLLWGHGVSGDRPILIFHRRSEESALLQQLLRAHRFFAAQNYEWDLVIVVHDATGYVDEAREQIRRINRSLDFVDLHPNVNIVSAGQMRRDALEALEASAGIILDSETGDLSEQLSREIHQPKLIPRFIPTRSAQAVVRSEALQRRRGLLFDNGIGGFDANNHEYLLFLAGTESSDATPALPPAPWCNVLSNPKFGTLVSERGLGCTWAHNASENRLTPWSNDPVSDPPSEAIYLRDEETAEVWSPTPGPRTAELPYEVAHGLGYTRFRHRSHGLMQTVKVFVHADETVKFVEIEINNLSDRNRRLTSTYFADWVLGGRSATHGAYVIPSFDPDARAIFASNPWNLNLPEQTAFLVTSEKVHGFTVDPVEFLGLGGPSDPDALRRWGLSNRQETGALSCAALQVHLDLAPRESRRFHFALGWGENRREATALATRNTQRPDCAASALVQTRERWRNVLQRVAVSTPDTATDLMLNSWALYQTVSSRLYARTGFYQSSGAIGFRDQLQDVMSLSAIVPALARDHILTAAAHQFDAGDVLHWWHPLHGQGVRTRCSDDLLWLPYAVVRYIETTGDRAILDEEVGYLSGPELGPGELDHYATFERSSSSSSLYEHCMRALDRGYALGPQKLPLMGGGDWNDGMNLVGAEGTGESVWLGWFLYSAMQKFAALCGQQEQGADERRLTERCQQLLGPLEKAWDGEWYRRAYYDDGAALGSAANSEARIDSISQSWAVLSGAAPRERAHQALLSAVRELVDEDARILRLLWPPFDRDSHEPGYIKGYPPGIRENGAQYTHAATWLVWALFEADENEKATELFQFLNPITHGSSQRLAQEYVVEPYVLSGDVYSCGPHRGRGGWSWYTGSSAWYWRIGVEQLLGCRVQWPYLEIAPRIPAAWPGCQVALKLAKGSFDIDIVNSESEYDGVVEATIDEQPLLYTGQHPRLDLRKHQGHHAVRVVLGRRSQLSAKAALQ